MLTSELEQRAGTIAYLTSQLHATGEAPEPGGTARTAARPAAPRADQLRPAPLKDRLPETPGGRMKKSLSARCTRSSRRSTDSGPRAGTAAAGAGGRHAGPHPIPAGQESAEVHLIKERPLVIPHSLGPQRRRAAQPRAREAAQGAAVAWRTASTMWPRRRPAPRGGDAGGGPGERRQGGQEALRDGQNV